MWIRVGRFPRKVGADGRTVLRGNEPRGERGWKLGGGGGKLEERETGKFFEKSRIGASGEVVWGLVKVENNPEKRKFGLADGVHCEEGMVESSEGGSEGEITTSQSFGEGKDVGHDPFRMGGQRGTCPTEASEDLVKENTCAHLASGGGGAFGVAVGVHDHASGALDSWFQNPSGECIARLMNLFFGKGGAFKFTFSIGAGIRFFRFGLIEWAAVAGGSHDFA